MDNKALLNKFYTSFIKGDSQAMGECYHTDVVFKDPVFGTLKGARACKMWEMLLTSKKGELKVSYKIARVSDKKGKVNWVAEYHFGKNNRKVINNVSGEFKFEDGKIIEHIDTFNLWKWSKQAMGTLGYLIGWTPLMKKKIQKSTNKKLNNFIAGQGNKAN
ncbi:MAG: nuclear transport factor 2 family protein [Cytophagales bacterium]|uniref:nuclear transport factor 2 family protein n=1 Tax=Cyclobacterium marinum TaxID=104 RepID=UPI0030DD3E92|nr:nuclear transport factor 2 family protein [Cytophagales bacterium]|tara:strand:- start:69755 stop:70237 length:483 start_codon:yes stop_codon:yes gene_type:complete